MTVRLGIFDAATGAAVGAPMQAGARAEDLTALAQLLAGHRIDPSGGMIALSLVYLVGAAILTPPDVVSQVLLAGPLVVLYLLGVGVAYIVTLRRKKN